MSLTHNDLVELVKATVKESLTLFVPGASEEEKKDWCVEKLTDILESFDNALPVIGVFLDNPIADSLERRTVRALVDWGWEQADSVHAHPVN